MSWEYACKLEEQLKQEVATLLSKAESESSQGKPEIDIPQELQRRQARLSKISQIKMEIDQRAQARYELKYAEYESKMAQRADKEKARGRKLGGRPPQAPQPGRQSRDQMNFTDSESRIMPLSGGGFEPAYNAQASVDMNTLLIVGNHGASTTQR